MERRSAYWSKRIGRRGMLRGAAIGGLGLAGAALIGCGGDDEEAAPTAEGAAATETGTISTGSEATPAGGQMTGGNLRYAAVGDPGPFDLMSVATAGAFYFIGPVYSTLLSRSYDDSLNMTFEPDLAESWEREPDGMTYVLRLRQGVKFHNRVPTNGRELTTDDIKFSIEREVSGTSRPRGGQYGTIETVEFPDASTLKLTLKEPAADFMNWLADPYHIIMPTEVDDDFVKIDAVGTGPFILKEYREGVAGELERNPDYFIPDRPFLETIHTASMADQDSMIAAFRAGDLDLSAASAGGYLRPRQVASVLESIPDAQIYRIPNLNVGHIRYNLETAPFNDDRVRRAVGLTIDDASWIAGLFDGEGSRTAPVPWGLGAWSLDASTLPARGGEEQLREAAQLMSAAGYESGLSVTNFSLGSPPSVSTTTGIALLEEALGKINVSLEVRNNDYASWLQGLVDKQFELNLITGVLGFTEAGTYVETYFWDEGGRGYTKHGDAELNDMIARQRVTIDEQERMALIHDIQRRVVEMEYYTMLQSDYIAIAGAANLRGHSLDLLHGGNMRNSWRWSLEA